MVALRSQARIDRSQPDEIAGAGGFSPLPRCPLKGFRLSYPVYRISDRELLALTSVGDHTHPRGSHVLDVRPLVLGLQAPRLPGASPLRSAASAVTSRRRCSESEARRSSLGTDGSPVRLPHIRDKDQCRTDEQEHVKRTIGNAP